MIPAVNGLRTKVNDSCGQLSSVNCHLSSSMTCYIKENSWIAHLAAKKLNFNTVGIVIGRTIHLHNATREELLKNQRWLRHEIMHIRQFQQYGFLRFIILYLIESAKKGYRNNKFEIEARASEGDETILTGITIG